MIKLPMKTRFIYLKFIHFDYWLLKFLITFETWKLHIKNEIPKDIFWDLIDFKP